MRSRKGILSWKRSAGVVQDGGTSFIKDGSEGVCEGLIYRLTIINERPA